jgi:hypothetical protein
VIFEAIDSCDWKFGSGENQPTIISSYIDVLKIPAILTFKKSVYVSNRNASGMKQLQGEG